jgi:hypothetical protein
MVNLHAALVHNFLQLAVADRISHLPAEAPHDHLPLEMATLELDHRLPSHRTRCRRSYVAAGSGEDLRPNPPVSVPNSRAAEGTMWRIFDGIVAAKYRA